eukprot:COSAG04_NODE_14934_length_549_cov_1.248889_1_plen_79_part_01
MLPTSIFISLSTMLTTTAATVAADLPPPRAPTALLVAEPTTADTLRHIHEMLPQDEDKPMSEMDRAASFQRFLDARGGR